MPRKKEIDREELKALMKDRTVDKKEIASYFNCSVGTINNELRRIERDREMPPGAPKGALSIQNQLIDLRRRIRRILEEASEKVKVICPDCQKEIAGSSHDPQIAINASREIRGQMKLELELAKAWVHVQAVADWQRETIEAIMNVCTDKQKIEIMKALKEKQAWKNSLKPPEE